LLISQKKKRRSRAAFSNKDHYKRTSMHRHRVHTVREQTRDEKESHPKKDNETGIKKAHGNILNLS